VSDRLACIEDLEKKQQDIEYKSGIVLKRMQMAGDTQERKGHAGKLGELKEMLKILGERVEELRQARGDDWEDLSREAEKAYQDVWRFLQEVSEGVVK
jgi:hypothetical protein